MEDAEEDEFARLFRESAELITRMAQSTQPLLDTTNTLQAKTQRRLDELRRKYPRPPENQAPPRTPPEPPVIRERPDWLQQATASTSQSPEFRQLCRELLWRVGEGYANQSAIEKCATLDDAYARLQRESAVAGQFEALAASTLDAALADRASLYRLDGRESYVDACEREASGAIMGLLYGLPGDDAPGALRALVGRPLPRALRSKLWGRRLGDLQIQRAYHAQRGVWDARSPHEDDVTARCVEVLADTEADKLCCARAAFSFLDGKERRDRSSGLPGDVYWLAKPLLSVLELDAGVIAGAVRCVLDRGLEPALVQGGTLAFGEDAGDNKSMLEGGAGAAALALRLGVQRSNHQRWWVPRDWLQRCRSLLVDLCPVLAEALHCIEDDGAAEACIARAIGRSMRRGLSDVLGMDALLFVWDQCVLTSFDLVIPYAAAVILSLLDEPLRFFVRNNDDPQVHEALLKLGKDLSRQDLEVAFRMVVPLVAPDARELTDAISARPPPAMLVEASLPGAAALGGLDTLVVDSLADGAGFTMHGTLQLQQLSCRLEWCEVFPARDALPDVIDRLLALSANRKRLKTAHQQYGGDDFDSSLREACALATCTALPGLAALYAGSYPSAIEAGLKDIVQDCVRLSLPVKADDDDRDGDGIKDDQEYAVTTGALLGERAPIIEVLLRKNSKPQDPGLGPGSATLQAAGIFAMRSAPGGLWPHYANGLMHLVYLAYNSLREQHQLLGIEESKQREIVSAEKAIEACKRAEAKKREDEAARRDALGLEEKAKIEEEERLEMAQQQGKRVAAADAADEKVKDAFLACVNAAKECGDEYTKCRAAFDAAEQKRAALLQALVAKEQKGAFKAVFASPSDVAEHCADAKKAKAYQKKFEKFAKGVRKAWGKSPDLKDAYVLPDAAAVDALIDAWRGPAA